MHQERITCIPTRTMSARRQFERPEPQGPPVVTWDSRSLETSGWPIVLMPAREAVPMFCFEKQNVSVELSGKQHSHVPIKSGM